MKPLVIASEVDDLGRDNGSWSCASAGTALASAAAACERGDAASASTLFGSAVVLLANAASSEHRTLDELHDRSGKEHRLVATREMCQLVEDALVYDTYFGLRRVTCSSAAEQAIAAEAVLCDLARHLPVLLLTLDAKAALASFAARTLGTCEDAAGAPDESACARSEQVVTLGVRERWKLGHLIYCLANRAAASGIERVVDALAAGDEQYACRLLNQATRDLEAASASMELAASCTAWEYCGQVRPTMHPPALEVALSGGLNADHRALRQAMSRLCVSLGETFSDLSDRSLELALARDGLLHADLSDLERHIVLTLRLVGSRPALDEPDEESAVQSLRALYLRRMLRYSTILRQGQLAKRGDSDEAITTPQA